MILQFEGREINGSTHERFYPRLCSVVRREGWQLIEVPEIILKAALPRPALGATDFDHNEISVSTILPANMKVRVLAHELGHALTGRPDHIWPLASPAEAVTRAEIVADSVAMRVCHGIGLDVRDVVATYLGAFGSDFVRLALDQDHLLISTAADRILQEIV